MLLQPRAMLRAGLNRVRKLVGAEPLPEVFSVRGELKQAGQIVVIFALMLVVLIGLIGIAIDTTYAWREALRVQRAADSAALAGVVYMPGNFTTATSTADNAATRNGFTSSTATTVSVIRPANPRELDVSITTQVPTFFSRIFGINYFAVTRLSKAVYVTPVPMGSPLGYYGVYQLCPVTGTCIGQGSPSGVSVSSEGFFGAIEGEGSNTSTGDAFAPYYNGNPTLNSQYTADGYRYIIQANAAGTVYLYDPVFCATSTMSSSAHAGTGDHWLGTPTPVSTYFILWDTHNVPLAPATWTQSAVLPEVNQNQTDQSTTYGSGGHYSDSGAPTSPGDCTNNIREGRGRSGGNLFPPGDYDGPEQPGRQPQPELREHVLDRGLGRGHGLRVWRDGNLRQRDQRSSGVLPGSDRQDRRRGQDHRDRPVRPGRHRRPVLAPDRARWDTRLATDDVQLHVDQRPEQRQHQLYSD